MTYHFKIVIEGDSEDKESINRLYENLWDEVWHENSVVREPEITFISRQPCFWEHEYDPNGLFCENCLDKKECENRGL
jgi:hypothetical protein